MKKGDRVVYQGRVGTVEGSMPNGMIDIRFDDAIHRVERRGQNLLAKANTARANSSIRVRKNTNEGIPARPLLDRAIELKNKISAVRTYGTIANVLESQVGEVKDQEEQSARNVMINEFVQAVNSGLGDDTSKQKAGLRKKYDNLVANIATKLVNLDEKEKKEQLDLIGAPVVRFQTDLPFELDNVRLPPIPKEDLRYEIYQRIPKLPCATPEVYVDENFNFAFWLTPDSLERATRVLRGLPTESNASELQIDEETARKAFKDLAARTKFFRRNTKKSLAQKIERERERVRRRLRAANDTRLTSRDEDRQREVAYEKAWKASSTTSPKASKFQEELSRLRGAYLTRPDPPRVSPDGKSYCGNPIDGVAYYLVVDTTDLSVSEFITWDLLENSLRRADGLPVNFTTQVPVIEEEELPSTSVLPSDPRRVEVNRLEEEVKNIENQISNHLFDQPFMRYRAENRFSFAGKSSGQIETERRQLVTRAVQNLLNQDRFQTAYNFLVEYGRCFDRVEKNVPLAEKLRSLARTQTLSASREMLHEAISKVEQNERIAALTKVLPYIEPRKQESLHTALASDLAQFERLFAIYAKEIQDAVKEKTDNILAEQERGEPTEQERIVAEQQAWRKLTSYPVKTPSIVALPTNVQNRPTEDDQLEALARYYSAAEALGRRKLAYFAASRQFVNPDQWLNNAVREQAQRLRTKFNEHNKVWSLSVWRPEQVTVPYTFPAKLLHVKLQAAGFDLENDKLGELGQGTKNALAQFKKGPVLRAIQILSSDLTALDNQTNGDIDRKLFFIGVGLNDVPIDFAVLPEAVEAGNELYHFQAAQTNFASALGNLNQITARLQPIGVDETMAKMKAEEAKLNAQLGDKREALRRARLRVPREMPRETRAVGLRSTKTIGEMVRQVAQNYIENSDIPAAARDATVELMVGRALVEQQVDNTLYKYDSTNFKEYPKKGILSIEIPSLDRIKEVNKEFDKYRRQKTASRRTRIYALPPSSKKARQYIRVKKPKEIINRRSTPSAEEIGKQKRADTAYKETDIRQHFAKPSAEGGLEFYREVGDRIPGFEYLEAFQPFRYKSFSPEKTTTLARAVASALSCSEEQAINFITCGAVATPPVESRQPTAFEVRTLGLDQNVEVLVASGRGYPLVNLNPNTIVPASIDTWKATEDEQQDLTQEEAEREGARFTIWLKDKSESPFFSWKLTTLSINSENSPYPPCLSQDQELALRSLGIFRSILQRLSKAYGSFRSLITRLAADPLSFKPERVDPDPIRRYVFEERRYVEMPRFEFASDVRQVATALTSAYTALQRWLVNLSVNLDERKQWAFLVNSVVKQLEGPYGDYILYELRPEANRYEETVRCLSDGGLSINRERTGTIIYVYGSLEDGAKIESLLRSENLLCPVVGTPKIGGGLRLNQIRTIWSPFISEGIGGKPAEKGQLLSSRGEESSIGNVKNFNMFLDTYEKANTVSKLKSSSPDEFKPDQIKNTSLIRSTLLWLQKPVLPKPNDPTGQITYVEQDNELDNTPIDDLLSFIWASLDASTQRALQEQRKLTRTEVPIKGKRKPWRLFRDSVPATKAALSEQERKYLDETLDEVGNLLEVVGTLAAGGVRMKTDVIPEGSLWAQKGIAFGDITRLTSPLDVCPEEFLGWFDQAKEKIPVFKKLVSRQEIQDQLDNESSKLSKEWNAYRQLEIRYSPSPFRRARLNYPRHPVFELELPYSMVQAQKSLPELKDKSWCINLLLSEVFPVMRDSQQLGGSAQEVLRSLLLLTALYYDLGGYALNGPVDNQHPAFRRNDADLTTHMLERAVDFIGEQEIKIKGGTSGLATQSKFAVYMTYNPILFHYTRLYWGGSRRVASDFTLAGNENAMMDLDTVGRYGESMRLIQMSMLAASNKTQFQDNIKSFFYAPFAINPWDIPVLTTFLRSAPKKRGQPRPEKPYGRKEVQFTAPEGVQTYSVGLDVFGNEIGHYTPFCLFWPFGAPVSSETVPRNAVNAVFEFVKDPLHTVRVLKKQGLEPAVLRAQLAQSVGLTKKRETPKLTLESPLVFYRRPVSTEKRKVERKALLDISGQRVGETDVEFTTYADEEIGQAVEDRATANLRVFLRSILINLRVYKANKLLFANMTDAELRSFLMSKSNYTEEAAQAVVNERAKIEAECLNSYREGIGFSPMVQKIRSDLGLVRPEAVHVSGGQTTQIASLPYGAYTEVDQVQLIGVADVSPPPAELKPLFDERTYKRMPGKGRSKGLRRFTGQDPIHPRSVLSRAQKQLQLRGPILDKIAEESAKNAERIETLKRRLKKLTTKSNPR